MAKSEHAGESIHVVPLDDYVAANKIKNVGLIKVDVEGAEQYFLRGAKKTIAEQRPILLISIYHNYSDFFKIKPMIESWGLNYRFSFFHGADSRAPLAEVLLVCEPE